MRDPVPKLVYDEKGKKEGTRATKSTSGSRYCQKCVQWVCQGHLCCVPYWLQFDVSRDRLRSYWLHITYLYNNGMSNLLNWGQYGIQNRRFDFFQIVQCNAKLVFSQSLSSHFDFAKGSRPSNAPPPPFLAFSLKLSQPLLFENGKIYHRS